MKNPKKGIRTGNVFWGLLLVLVAVFLIVNQLGFLEDINIFTILFAIFWVSVLIEGLTKRSFGKILFSLAFLFIIFDEQLGIKGVSNWSVLAAALLGTIGLNMIFRRKKHCHFGKINMHSENHDTQNREPNSLEGNQIFFRTVMGSAVKYVNSDNFESAFLECSFGGMQVYFDQAIIQNGTANIEVDIAFSGVELYFPKSWEVVNQTNTSFSGLEERNSNDSTGAPLVTLTGNIKFSGVTIIYV